MNFTAKIAAVAALSVGLTGCASGGLQDNKNTLAGAGLGGAFGAILGRSVSSDKDRGTKLGGLLGAAVGAGLGAQLDEQERALRGAIGDDGAMITNTGEQLIVTLPEDVTFDVNSSIVKPRFVGPLGQLAANLNQYPNSRIQIVGHTDDRGTVAYNNNLSASRAQSVANVLVNSGVSRGRITTLGDGEFNPVASNASAQGRQANRRVVITITPTAAG